MNYQQHTHTFSWGGAWGVIFFGKNNYRYQKRNYIELLQLNEEIIYANPINVLNLESFEIIFNFPNIFKDNRKMYV